MKIEIVGKNGFHPSEANKEYVLKKLSKIEHHFEEAKELEARVVCKVYKEFHKVEITIPTKNFIMRAEVTDVDLYASIDRAIDKLLSQIRKYKTRVKDRSEREATGEAFGGEPLDVESLEKEIIASQLVRNKQVELKPMSVEEAMSQMELLGHNFFIYLDKDTNRTNVLYLREDGDYAVIETR